MNQDTLENTSYIRQICRREEGIDSDCNADFTLPDYLPEIRRILRTDTALVSTGHYQSGNRAEFAGTAAYTLIYTDPEGGIASYPLQADYEYATREMPELDHAVATERAETVLCRPQGPRRVNIRTRVRSRASLFATAACLTPAQLRPDCLAEEDVETLRKETVALWVGTASSGELNATESLRAEGLSAEQGKVLWCRGDVVLPDVAVISEGVVCRGEIRLVCAVLPEEGALPRIFNASLPVFETVPVEGAREKGAATARGACRSVEVTLADDGQEGSLLTMDVLYELEVCLAENRPLHYVADLYAIPRRVACRYREEVLERLLGCSQMNVTVSGTAPRREGEEGEASAVVDTTGRILTTELSFARGKAVVSGEWEAHMILLGGPDCVEGNARFLPATARLPYRVEVTLPEGLAEDATVHLSLHSVEGKLDRDAYYLTADIALSLCAITREKIQAVEEVRCLEEEEESDMQPGELLLYYPGNEDSLWSIGKHYRRRLTELARENDLPEPEVNTDLPKKLDGHNTILVG